ncbi:MAG: FadR family transcriptional regulator [Actinobacteria bacterium]|nr:FadR family transcriptional regulator [Actinomycetota bacterium]
MAQGDEVSDRLRALLDERGLRPGDRLPAERALAAELGISRARLREGLRRLGALGLLEARRGSGHYLTTVDLGDLLEVRLRLEPYAAGLAAARRDDEDLRLFERRLAELRATESQPERFASADLSLHGAVLAAARNDPLRIMLDALSDLLRYSRTRTVSEPQMRSGALVDLEALVGAIRAEAAPAAEAAMRAHLEAVSATLGLDADED